MPEKIELVGFLLRHASDRFNGDPPDLRAEARFGFGGSEPQFGEPPQVKGRVDRGQFGAFHHNRFPPGADDEPLRIARDVLPTPEFPGRERYDAVGQHDTENDGGFTSRRQFTPDRREFRRGQTLT
jgi:hypothetical protein